MFVGFFIFSLFHCVVSGLVHLDVPKVLVVTRVELFLPKSPHTCFSFSLVFIIFLLAKKVN